jgi:uncharacterized membrane protein YkgB
VREADVATHVLQPLRKVDGPFRLVAGRLVVEDAIMLGAAAVTIADSAKLAIPKRKPV